MATSLNPRPGDVVELANYRWAVVDIDDRRLELLRLNEDAPTKPEPEVSNASNVMDVLQVAEELGLAPKTIREYLNTGQLRGRKVGNTWRILRSENPMLAVG